MHVEPVGFYHFAHSYVRGNWAREKDSSFSLMTKSCQYVTFVRTFLYVKYIPDRTFYSDIDILGFYLSPATPVRVSSFGSLTHFRKSEKPAEAGSATRCLDCPLQKSCPYSAKRSKHVPPRVILA